MSTHPEPRSAASKEARERQWLEENREAIAAYNARVVQHGVLSDHAGLLASELSDFHRTTPETQQGA